MFRNTTADDDLLFGPRAFPPGVFSLSRLPSARGGIQPVAIPGAGTVLSEITLITQTPFSPPPLVNGTQIECSNEIPSRECERGGGGLPARAREQARRDRTGSVFAGGGIAATAVAPKLFGSPCKLITTFKSSNISRRSSLRRREAARRDGERQRSERARERK